MGAGGHLATAEGLMARGDDRATTALEISVVMPCLNEAETLAVCIGKAQKALREQGIAGDVLLGRRHGDRIDRCTGGADRPV